MEEMRTGFDKGAERKANPAYTACSRQIAALRTEIDAIRATSADKAEVRALLGRITAVQKERRKIPSVDPMDPHFPRLRYCRYAADFLVGVYGSQADEMSIMAEIQNSIADTINHDA